MAEQAAVIAVAVVNWRSLQPLRTRRRVEGGAHVPGANVVVFESTASLVSAVWEIGTRLQRPFQLEVVQSVCDNVLCSWSHSGRVSYQIKVLQTVFEDMIVDLFLEDGVWQYIE